jgi:hypothetical protein
MESLSAVLLANKVLTTAMLAWLLAQVLKTITNIVSTGRFDASRFWESGGMPSAHSALVVSLATAILLAEGISSPVFALAGAVALVVMYDAIGVRREAGKHADILNEMVRWVFGRAAMPADERQQILTRTPALKETLHPPEGRLPKELKELLGHTPSQVVAGCLLGILVALWVGR